MFIKFALSVISAHENLKKNNSEKKSNRLYSERKAEKEKRVKKDKIVVIINTKKLNLVPDK
jgi:hypothetical protein